MTSISFYARGDSSTANNSALNAMGTSSVPTTLLTFTSGETGDIKLDYNGGLNDPDTQVIINGTTYSFRVEFTGTLPQTNKLANVGGVDLRGDQIIVITASNGQRYFFLLDGSGTLSIMNAFPNGAHTIGNVNLTPGPVLVCFLSGTLIATPDGETPVEALRPGDLVLTAAGQPMPLRWIGSRRISAAEAGSNPDLRPVILPAHSFGPGLPARDLGLSPAHRIAFDGWRVELHFGCPRVLVPAAHLCPAIAHRAPPGAAFDYYHLLLDRHELVLSNGLATESFQPGQRGILSLGEAEMGRLCAATGQSRAALLSRPDAARTLKRHEAELLLRLAQTQQQAAA